MSRLNLVITTILVFGLLTHIAAASFHDDPFTLGLWDMDTFDSGAVPDINAARGNDLLLSAGASITTGNQGFTGEALQFTGLENSHARAENNWTGASTLRFEAWVKPTAVKDSQLLYLQNVLQLQIKETGDFLLFGRDPQEGWGSHTRVVGFNAVKWNEWVHVAVTIDEDGWMTLYVDGEIAASDEAGNPRQLPSGALNTDTPIVNFGGSSSTNPTFVGLLDNVRIAVLERNLIPKIDDAATFALYHMEAIEERNISGELREVVLDDDSANPGRERHLVLGKWADSGYSGMEPELVNDGVFGKALAFDGIDHMAWMPDWNGSDYLKFETWVKPYNFKQADFSTREPVLFEISSCLRLFYRGDRLRLAVRMPDNSGWAPVIMIYVPEGVWDHVTVEVQPDGFFSLSSLFGHVAGTTGVGGWRSVALPRIGIGNAPGNVFAGKQFFEGLMDDMKISDSVIPCGGKGYPYGDLNQDCEVGYTDLMIMVESWLKSTDPADPDAIKLN